MDNSIAKRRKLDGTKAQNLINSYKESNTKYFHLVTNGKYRKTCIFQLEDDGQIIKRDEPLKSYITEYYK
jgi:hypothetical protein